MPKSVLNSNMVGFFGKLPSTGDFVARGLPIGLRPFLDRWLTRNYASCIDGAEDWPLNGYRAIIKWGDSCLILLILPSNDKLGRVFPLSICRATRTVPDKQSADVWCGTVLDLAKAAISNAMTADELLLALEQIEETTLTSGNSLMGDLVWP